MSRIKHDASRWLVTGKHEMRNWTVDQCLKYLEGSKARCGVQCLPGGHGLELDRWIKGGILPSNIVGCDNGSKDTLLGTQESCNDYGVRFHAGALSRSMQNAEPGSVHIINADTCSLICDSLYEEIAYQLCCDGPATDLVFALTFQAAREPAPWNAKVAEYGGDAEARVQVILDWLEEFGYYVEDHVFKKFRSKDRGTPMIVAVFKLYRMHRIDVELPRVGRALVITHEMIELAKSERPALSWPEITAKHWPHVKHDSLRKAYLRSAQ